MPPLLCNISSVFNEKRCLRHRTPKRFARNEINDLLTTTETLNVEILLREALWRAAAMPPLLCNLAGCSMKAVAAPPHSKALRAKRPPSQPPNHNIRQPRPPTLSIDDLHLHVGPLRHAA